MRRPGDRFVLGMLAASVIVATMAPLVVTAVQIIRDPPPYHAVLYVFGAVDEAIEHLAWGLGLSGVVLGLRAVFDAIRSRGTSERRWFSTWLPFRVLRGTCDTARATRGA